MTQLHIGILRLMIYCIVLTISLYYFCASLLYLRQYSSILLSLFSIIFLNTEAICFQHFYFQDWFSHSSLSLCSSNMFGTSNCNTYTIVRISIHIESAPEYGDNIVSRGPWQLPALQHSKSPACRTHGGSRERASYSASHVMLTPII